MAKKNPMAALAMRIMQERGVSLKEAWRIAKAKAKGKPAKAKAKAKPAKAKAKAKPAKAKAKRAKASQVVVVVRPSRASSTPLRSTRLRKTRAPSSMGLPPIP